MSNDFNWLRNGGISRPFSFGPTCPEKMPHRPIITRMLKTAEPTMVPTPTSPFVINTPENTEQKKRSQKKSAAKMLNRNIASWVYNHRGWPDIFDLMLLSFLHITTINLPLINCVSILLKVAVSRIRYVPKHRGGGPPTSLPSDPAAIGRGH